MNLVDFNFENRYYYAQSLKRLAKLTPLCSEETQVPYLYYKTVESIFSHCIPYTINISKQDLAVDIIYKDKGIAIKTFIERSGKSCSEKIGEFDACVSNRKNDLQFLKDISSLRNERLEKVIQDYNIKKNIFHIIYRYKYNLLLFNVECIPIDIKNISILKKTKAGISFDDMINNYNFNYAKSTLFQKFLIPKKISIPNKTLIIKCDLSQNIEKILGNLK